MKIKEWISQNHTTLTDFAEMVGITKGTLSKIMHYKCSASLRTAQRVYEITNGEVPHHEMLSDSDIKIVIDARKKIHH